VLAGVERGLSVTGAAAAAGVHRSLVYKWLREPEFASAWRLAMDAGADMLEDEALRRAMAGIDKPVFYRGEAVGIVRTYNDRLLILLLERRRPTLKPDGEVRQAQQRASDHVLQSLLEDTRQFCGALATCNERIKELTDGLNEARRELAAATGAAMPERVSYDPVKVFDDEERQDGDDAAGEIPAAASADTGGADTRGADTGSADTGSADETGARDAGSDAAPAAPAQKAAVLSVSKCLPASVHPPGWRAPLPVGIPGDSMPDDMRRLCADLFQFAPPEQDTPGMNKAVSPGMQRGIAPHGFAPRNDSVLGGCQRRPGLPLLPAACPA
jgi:hypothetical protein